MSQGIIRTLAVGAAVMALTGCTNAGDEFEGTRLNKKRSLVTTATVRLVYRTEIPGENGSSKTVTCAEPSPDVAQAVSRAFGGGLSAEANLEGVPVEVAASLTLARAQAVAQMTERLATIQLLRDGLYRACEAYANQAISDTTYAVLLSRYDDTMITMLLGELAAGNFGRELATIGGTASASSDAGIGELTKESIEQAQKIQAEIDALEETEKAQEKKLTELEETAAEKKTASEKPNASDASKEEATAAASAVEKQRKELGKTRTNIAKKRRDLAGSVRAASQSTAATQAKAAGSIANAKVDVASKLEKMQRNYLHNINADAAVVACMTALDNDSLSPALLSASIALGQANSAAYSARSKLDAFEQHAVNRKNAGWTNSAAFLNLKGTADRRAREKVAAFKRYQATAGRSATNALAFHCLTGILPTIYQANGEQLRALLERANDEKFIAAEFRTVVDALEKLDRIKGAIAGPKKQPDGEPVPTADKKK